MSNLPNGCLNITQELFIGFTGAPGEALLNNQLADEVGSDRVIRLAGLKRLCGKLLVLYTRSSIFLVTNDSGPAHFASMTPIRVIALFGPGDTGALWRAIAKRDRLVGRHRLPIRA